MMKLPYRALGLIAISTVILASCAAEDPDSGGPFGGGGDTGDGGTVSTGGSNGMGGEGGEGGEAGTTGSGGAGGMAGAGGSVGSGGTGGGGGMGPCSTNNLCRTCPDQFLCDDDDDCFTGWTCVDSGCDTHEGDSIGQCQVSPGGACATSDDCLEDYECLNVPLQGTRCVKTTPGCNTSFDCVMGFSCEGGTCVDRRVPCVLDEDCPMNHSCEMPTPSNRFCVRIHQTCYEEFDCGVLAPYCVDVDGDTRKECAGAPHPAEPACLNSTCGGSAPVCEASTVGSITNCGQYGLCTGGECAPGFACVGLWTDGRKECVPTGGECDHISDCALNEVCASPRTGGPPACQAGAVN